MENCTLNLSAIRAYSRSTVAFK